MMKGNVTGRREIGEDRNRSYLIFLRNEQKLGFYCKVPNCWHKAFFLYSPYNNLNYITVLIIETESVGKSFN